MQRIGITERGDAALDWADWWPWVSEGQPAILISKNPQMLAERLDTSKIQTPNVIVHATITGYGGTPLEPNVPSVTSALEGFAELNKLLGKDRVVLRIDPVIPTVEGTKIAVEILQRAGKDNRVRVSFIDMYSHVRERLSIAGIDLHLTWNLFHAPLGLRFEAWNKLGRPEVCGEPGFKCTGCVSGSDCKILGVEPIEFKSGQRPDCTCLAMKAELLHRKAPCSHACCYCYWRG